MMFGWFNKKKSEIKANNMEYTTDEKCVKYLTNGAIGFAIYDEEDKLLKESTKMYKEGDLEKAIELIDEAIKLYEGKNYYVTGDSLYNKDIFADLPRDIEAVFLPVNGVGNNFNMADARRFAKDCGAKKAVPLHVGLFDDKKPEGFEIIPEFYKEIKL